MKTTLTLLALAATLPLAAQTPAAKPAVHHTTTAPATHPAGACVKLPEISAKVPALPAGSACAKSLYTIVTTPSVKLEDISPMESPALKEFLGIESSSFTLAYVDTRVGTGALAAPGKFYTVNYTGYLVDGTQFDSSVGKDPITFKIGEHQVIPGWDTGFDGMHVGGKRRIFIPFQLAYGAQGKGPIPAKAELIFDMELIAQSDTPPAPKTPPTPPAPPAAKPATPDATKPATPAPPAATSPAGASAPPPTTSQTPAKTAPTNPAIPK